MALLLNAVQVIFYVNFSAIPRAYFNELGINFEFRKECRLGLVNSLLFIYLRLVSLVRAQTTKGTLCTYFQHVDSTIPSITTSLQVQNCQGKFLKQRFT